MTTALRRYMCVAMILAAALSACRGRTASDADAPAGDAASPGGDAHDSSGAAFGISVTPPAPGDEGLIPMRFVVRNGPRPIRQGSVQCHLERIETSTMRVIDDTEQAEDFQTLGPGAEHTVHCDPLVFLDPASGVTLRAARVTVDLEFEVTDVADRHFARFTFDAERDGQGQLRWTRAGSTAGPAATRYQ